jgi:hypothetical protein
MGKGKEITRRKAIKKMGFSSAGGVLGSTAFLEAATLGAATEQVHLEDTYTHEEEHQSHDETIHWLMKDDREDYYQQDIEVKYEKYSRELNTHLYSLHVYSTAKLAYVDHSRTRPHHINGVHITMDYDDSESDWFVFDGPDSNWSGVMSEFVGGLENYEDGPESAPDEAVIELGAYAGKKVLDKGVEKAKTRIAAMGPFGMGAVMLWNNRALIASQFTSDNGRDSKTFSFDPGGLYGADEVHAYKQILVTVPHGYDAGNVTISTEFTTANQGGTELETGPFILYGTSSNPY